jgi:hypothetical protein
MDSTRFRPGNKHPLNEHWELHADFEDERSHIVELEDGIRWRIWPGDIATMVADYPAPGRGHRPRVLLPRPYKSI